MVAKGIAKRIRRTRKGTRKKARRTSRNFITENIFRDQDMRPAFLR